MIKTLAFFITTTLLAQTYYLRDPHNNPTLTVTAISGSGVAQLTFDIAHNLSVGERIHCVGFSGLPKASTHLKVKSVVSSVAITITDTSDVDVPVPSGVTHTDLDTRIAGNQYGYCGKTTAVTINAHPRGWWQNSGSFNTQMKDPDGAGAAKAPIVTTDTAGWTALQNEIATMTTATCDGVTAALCTNEESTITSQLKLVQEMWPAVNLAVAWYADQSTNWGQSARYFLNNMHRATPYADIRGEFTGCDWTANECGRGEDNDTAGLAMVNSANAYSLIRGLMSAGERTAFADKIFLDEVDGCVNQLPNLSGAISMGPSTGTATGVGFSGYSVGDIIYIKDKHRVYKIDDTTLVSIAVSGSTGTVTIGSGLPLPTNSTYIKITNSSVTNLDGVYIISAPSGTTFTITTAGVAGGTYTTSGMEVRSFGSDDSTGQWKSITAIASDTSMTLTPSNGTTRIVNSIYSKLNTYSSNTCGLMWFMMHHGYAPVQRNARFGNSAATISASATSFALNTGTYPNFQDLATPFYIGVDGEIMQVTAKDDPSRTLTVTRGMFNSPQTQHLTSGIIWYQPFGPNTSMVTSAILKSIADLTHNLTHRKVSPIVNAAVNLLEDSAGARRAFEYHWNYYMDGIYRVQSATWAGFTPSGPAAPGYYFGSWTDLFAFTALTAKNSFSQTIDLTTKFPGMCQSATGMLQLARGDDHRYHLSYSDAGNVRDYETDDLKIHEASAYLCPAEAPELNYFIRNVLGFTNRETLPFRMAYYSATVTDYKTTFPKNKIWRTSGNGDTLNPYQYGGMTFRQSWTPGTDVTVGFVASLQGGDHVGTYAAPGGLFIAKGGAELICGSASGCAWFTDHRQHNGISVRVPPTAESATGGLSVPAGYTPTNGPVNITRGKIGSDYAYVRVVNKRYNSTVAVTSAHRDTFYLDTGTGPDYVVTYDRVLTGTGREKIYRIPYYRGNNVNGTIQSPTPTYSRTGDSIQMVSNQYSKSIRSKILYPTSGDATYADDTSITYATRFSATTSANEADFFVVHAPCGSANCTEPTWSLLSSSATYRFGQISDGTNVWVVGTAKDPADASTTLTYTVASHAGNAKHVISGLPVSTAWIVNRDDGAFQLASTDAEGVLRFDASFGGAGGVFTINYNGLAALDILTTTLPACQTGSSYSQALAATGGTLPYTWDVSLGTLPTGLTMSSGGVISGTCSSSGTFNFTARVTDNAAVVDTQALTIVVATVSITSPCPLPQATVNTSYSTTATASGGTAPYTWDLTSGSLPAGITLSSGGVFSGTPTVTGDFSFVLRVTDNLSLTNSVSCGLTVVAGLPLNLSPSPNFPATQLGQAVSGLSFIATNGSPPYTFAIVNGAAPPGVTLNATTGVFEGTPTKIGDYPVIAEVTDAAAATATSGATLKVRTNLTSITTTTKPVAEKVFLRVRNSGIGNIGCYAIILDQDGNVVSSLDIAASSAMREVVLPNLVSGSNYTYQVSCNGSLASNGSFTTTSNTGSNSTNLFFSAPPAASKIQVQYRAHGSVGAYTSVIYSCSPSCTVNIPDVTGMVTELRYDWLDGSNNVLFPSEVKFILHR